MDGVRRGLPVRLIHTSDWHIGHQLYGRKRFEEFALFFDWLAGYIEQQSVDGLLVAGDVFDTSTPGNRALGLYYDFLSRLSKSTCHHIAIIGGNHDSPTLLDGPREILKGFDIHVIGSPDPTGREEVLPFAGNEGQTELIVCAVPFLRDRDIRSAAAGETLEEKGRKLQLGIREHYLRVIETAEKLRREAGGDIPLVAMGHLFTAGGRTVEGDGVRELYIGNLSHFSADQFPGGIDYLALGHLHMAQRVGDNQNMWYSGSPLVMGFGELGQQKYILDLLFEGGSVQVNKVAVPSFQELNMLEGDLEELRGMLTDMVAAGSKAWVEVRYKGESLVGDLREQLFDMVKDSEVELLRIRNDRAVEAVLDREGPQDTLDDLEVEEVFDRCLTAGEVVEEQRGWLREHFTEVVRELHQEDVKAE